MPVIVAALLAVFLFSAPPLLADTFRTITRPRHLCRRRQEPASEEARHHPQGFRGRSDRRSRLRTRCHGQVGQWSDDGYFCRDLYFGEESLGPNCQLVEINGSTLRFTSDKGDGCLRRPSPALI